MWSGGVGPTVRPGLPTLLRCEPAQTRRGVDGAEAMARAGIARRAGPADSGSGVDMERSRARAVLCQKWSNYHRIFVYGSYGNQTNAGTERATSVQEAPAGKANVSTKISAQRVRKGAAVGGRER